MRTIPYFAGTVILITASSLFAADPEKKPAASLDDELFQGLDDATKAPGVKPTPSASGGKPAASSSSGPGSTAPQPTKPSESTVKPAAQQPAKSSNPLDDELLKSLG